MSRSAAAPDGRRPDEALTKSRAGGEDGARRGINSSRFMAKRTLTDVLATRHTVRAPSDQGAGVTTILTVIAHNELEEASLRGF